MAPKLTASVLKSIPYAKFNNACTFGQLHTLKHLLTDEFLKDIKFQTIVGGSYTKAEWGLIQAALHGQERVMDFLMNKEIMVEGDLLLEKAVFGGRVDTVKFILARYKDEIKLTCKHLEQAASGGNIDVVKYLVEEHKIKPTDRALKLAQDDLEYDDRGKGHALDVISYLEKRL